MSIFAELAHGIVAASASATRDVASRLARELPPDSVLALSGDLGAGKTTFVKGLAKAWGIPEPVTSPSFTLCNLHRGTRLLVHVDAYRLTRAEEWDGLLIEEFLESPWCLAVEWPERIGDRLSPAALWLEFGMREDGARLIRRLPPQRGHMSSP